MAKGIYVGVSEDSLITNGDFSNGLEGWTADSKLSAEVINENGENVLKITNITNSSVVAWVNVTQEFNPISGHKYYISAYTKGASNNTAGSYGLYVLAFDICATPQVGVTTDTWTFVSAIDSEADSQASFGTSIRLRIPIGATDNVSYFKNIKVYDLTEMFGTGNEPTQQWCDNNLTTLENLYKSKNSKARKVKKAYVGVESNLVVNGNFDNGLNSWEYSDNYYELSIAKEKDNNYMVAEVVNPATNATKTEVVNLGRAIGGHVVYARFDMKGETTNAEKMGVYLGVRFGESGAGSGSAFVLNSNFQGTEWVTSSGLTTIEEDGYIFLQLVAQSSSGTISSGMKLYFDNIALYDLTALFGAGNEPTKEWCDANFEALNKSVARKVKKGYIGVSKNLITNGDFNNGLTGWVHSNSANTNITYTIEDGWLVATCNTSYSDNASFDALYQNTYWQTNHKYYLCYKGKVLNYVKNADSSTTLGVHFSSGNVQNNLDLSILNEEQIISGLYTWTSTEMERKAATALRKVEAGTKVAFTGIRTFDLTALYGAGNEPDKAWCDANLEELNKSVARLFYSAETLVPFTSNPAPTTWTDSTDYKSATATNEYGEWIVSSNSVSGSGYRVSQAFDENTDNMYQTNSLGLESTSAALSLLPPSNVTINPTTITVRHRYAGSSNYPCYVRGYDGENWVTLGTLTRSSGTKTDTFTISGEKYYTHFDLMLYRYSSSIDYVRIYDFRIDSGTLKIE